MRRTCILHVAAWTVLARLAVPQAAGTDSTNSLRTLTLPQAYALAVEQSEALGASAEAWHAAEARYRGATAGRWPELAAVGSAEWRDAGGESGAESITHAGLGARYPVFSGFRTTRVIAARAAEREAFAQDIVRERQLLYLDVADVFYAALAADRQGAILAEQAQALEERVAELERRVALGRSRRAELLFAQSEVANARVAIAEARGARAATGELLAFLIGQPAPAFALADDTPLPDAPDVARYLEQTDARADVRAQAARREAAAANARAVNADRGLALDAGGNVYAHSDPGNPGDWDLTLRAELPLFDRGLRRAATAEQLAVMRASEIRLAEVRRSADRDARAAYAELVGALDQWAALGEAARVTEESVTLQRKDYELGRATHLDVLTALVQWHVSRRRAAVAEMQARTALIHLHVAAGVEPP